MIRSLAGLLFIASLPYTLAATNPHVIVAAISTLVYTLVVGSPFIGAGYLFIRISRR